MLVKLGIQVCSVAKQKMLLRFGADRTTMEINVCCALRGMLEQLWPMEEERVVH